MTAGLLEKPLTELTLEELVDAIRNADGDQATIDALVAEEKRRERAERSAAAARARHDALVKQWRAEHVEPEYALAEAVCNGNLLSRLGEAEDIREPKVLWTGSDEWAAARASEELNNLWDLPGHKRLNFTAWLREQQTAARVQREDIEKDKLMPGDVTRAVLENTGYGAAERAAERAAETSRTQAAVRDRLNARGRPARPVTPRAPRLTAPAPPGGYDWDVGDAGDRLAEARADIAGADVALAKAEVAIPEPGRVVTATAANVITPAAYRQPGTVAIDGVTLWYLVRRYISHYVAFRTQADLDIVTAWIFHAVARDRDANGMGPLIWRASPRLIPTSDKAQSGKSTLLDLIVILTQSNGKVPKTTPAAIARKLGQYFEVACLDEAKTIFGRGEKSLELQGLLLSGYTRRTFYEISGKRFSVFGAAAIAGKTEFIKDAEGTQIDDLVSRSFVIHMFPPVTPKPEIDEQAEEDGDDLARLMIEWTDAYRDTLKQAVRDLSRQDRATAEAAHAAAIAAGRKPARPEPRVSQISRPLRACALVAGPAVYADVCAALDGSARTEARDTMARLQERADSWGPGVVDDNAPGVLVTEPADDTGEDDDPWGE